MKTKWAALAAVTAMAITPAMAQNDMSNMGTMNSTSMTMNYKNVDEASARSDMDKLRSILDKMQENTRLQYASGDIVQGDGYRRGNVILLDNAQALAMNISNTLGGPMTIPAGWGLARDYVADVNACLAAARLAADYTTPIDTARDKLAKAYDAINQSSMGMSGGMGGNMNNM